MGKRQSGNKV